MEYPWPLVQNLLSVGVVMDLLVRLFSQENCSERLLRVLFFLAQLHCSKFKLQFKKYASLVRVEIYLHASFRVFNGIPPRGTGKTGHKLAVLKNIFHDE